MVEESKPAIYILSQSFLVNGKKVERVGCICALTLSDLGDEVLPHEQTIDKHLDKSTIADLIPRFYDVINGKIEIDGNDISGSLVNNDLLSLVGKAALTSTPNQGAKVNNQSRWLNALSTSDLKAGPIRLPGA